MISTVILFKDETESLKQCLDSLAWCDDVVIVQDVSDSDGNLPSLRPEVRVIARKLENNFSAQRTYGMNQTKHDWVLFLDADEVLSPDLGTFLTTFSTDDTIAAYTIPRIDIFWGKRITHGEVHSAATQGLLRLVHKRKGRWEGTVHERFLPIGKVDRVSYPMLHYPHQSITSFLQHVNTYSSLRGKEIKDVPVWRLFGEMIIYPPIKFIYTYGMKLGFLDGAAGFVYSFMMSFHSFLVRAKAITKTYEI